MQKIRKIRVISIKITLKCVYPSPVLATEVRKHNLRSNEFLIIWYKFCLLTILKGETWTGFSVEFLQVSENGEVPRILSFYFITYTVFFSDLKS